MDEWDFKQIEILAIQLLCWVNLNWHAKKIHFFQFGLFQHLQKLFVDVMGISTLPTHTSQWSYSQDGTIFHINIDMPFEEPFDSQATLKPP